MNLRTKTAMSAASVLIVAAGAAGCGGGSSSSAPDSASKGDFCGAFSTFETNIAGVDPSSKPADIIKKLKSEASKLRDTGTPSNITDSERDGYTTTLDAIDNLPDDASLEDLSKVTDDFSATDKKNAQAFQDYLDKECPDLGTDSGGAASPSAS